MKKAILIMQLPKNIYQFIWLYTSMSEEYEWTVVYGKVLDSMTNKVDYNQKTIEYCRNTKIFSDEIFIEKTVYEFSIVKKIKLLFKMFFSWLNHTQHKVVEYIYSKQVDFNNYDLVVISQDFDIMTGALCQMGKKKDVLILEDGTSDYLTRTKGFATNSGVSNRVVSAIIAKLGFANLGWQNWLESNKYCIKYAMMPNKMQYRNYKEIRQLFNFDVSDVEEYRHILKETFEYEDFISKNKIDAIIFTTDYTFFTKDKVVVADIYDKVEKYVNEKYSGKNIAIKKHPRDTYKYNFDKVAFEMTIDDTIPAEVLFPLPSKVDVCLCSVSTIIMSLNASNHAYDLLHFKELESARLDSLLDYSFEFGEKFELFKKENCSIIEA